MGNSSSKSWTPVGDHFQCDKASIDGDHKKHLENLQPCIPSDAVLLFRKPLMYPADGRPQDIQTGIIKMCEKFFAGAQVPPDLLTVAVQWLSTAFEEVICEGELLVMYTADGLKPLYTLFSSGGFDYHLVGTARYQVEVTKLVKKTEKGIKTLNKEKSRIAVTWTSIVEVRRSIATHSVQSVMGGKMVSTISGTCAAKENEANSGSTFKRDKDKRGWALHSVASRSASSKLKAPPTATPPEYAALVKRTMMAKERDTGSYVEVG